MNVLNSGVDTRGDASPNDGLHGGRRDMFQPRMHELSGVDLGHCKFRFCNNNNNRSFRATDEDSVMTSLISNRLKFLGSVGPGRWARECSDFR